MSQNDEVRLHLAAVLATGLMAQRDCPYTARQHGLQSSLLAQDSLALADAFIAQAGVANCSWDGK